MEHLGSDTGIDLERPSQARIYDYLLGGSHNFAVDREAARQLIAMAPEVPLVAQANRAFLRRAVHFLVGAGIRQFLDVGSGVPTAGNVHEVAHRTAPESRVVYVDVDPMAVAEGRQILASNDRTAVIEEDARRPERILTHPAVRELIDFGRPVGVLLASLLHFIPDADDPAAIVAVLRDAVAPGSYVVISHVTSGSRPTASSALAANQHRRIFASGRTRAEVQRLFAGFDLVEPGLVPVEEWRPEPANGRPDGREPLCMHAGVGYKTEVRGRVNRP